MLTMMEKAETKRIAGIRIERERCAKLAEESYVAHLVSNSVELALANRIKNVVALNIRRML